MKQYLGRRHHISVPTVEECLQLPKVDLQQFTSTWLSMSVKNIQYVGVDVRCLQKTRHNSKYNKFPYKASIKLGGQLLLT